MWLPSSTNITTQFRHGWPMSNVLRAAGIYVADTLVIAFKFLRCRVVWHRILIMCKAILSPEGSLRHRGAN